MSNRTVLVDNNTWNNTHIATVGRALASSEEKAYPIMEVRFCGTERDAVRSGIVPESFRNRRPEKRSAARFPREKSQQHIRGIPSEIPLNRICRVALSLLRCGRFWCGVFVLCWCPVPTLLLSVLVCFWLRYHRFFRQVTGLPLRHGHVRVLVRLYYSAVWCRIKSGGM